MENANAEIDQFTFNVAYREDKLQSKLDEIIRIFRLNELFEAENSAGINGYSLCLNYGLSDAKIKILFNTEESKRYMGICIVFSASGKHLYETEYELKFNQKIQWERVIDSIHQINGHITRMDVAIDFFNLENDLTQIADDIRNKEIVVKNKVGIIKPERIKQIGSPNNVQTIYVGSRNSDCFLRVYDKKTEQLENKGRFKYLANNSKNWIRVEGEFKHDYVRRLEKAIDLSTGNLLSKFVFIVYDHWKFMKSNELELTELWLKLQELLKVDDFGPVPVQLVDPIENAIIHFFTKGGAMFFWKMKQLFPDQDVEQILFENVKGYIKDNKNVPKSAISFVKKIRKLNYDLTDFNPYLTHALLNIEKGKNGNE
ncbi:replication initiation factor domain-containing protein [Ligilactobacillus aviarius]|uniref:replication initiation factor domain-containing protein n=1 Tax=Ligilactobacillus aviarius TaxID=1606 RepID=UPI0024BA0C54|nr:replication initiation factor domain-containing protein [Ligilactobacillus aviarius]